MSLINAINGSNRVIAYRPEFRDVFPNKRLSATSTILFQQILFRFKPDKSKQGEPFYKFKEPCEHRLYRDGDSWCEELGFTKKEFDTALKHIAYRYSKTNEADKVDGYKTLDDCLKDHAIVYQVDSNRLTNYHVNEALTNQMIEDLYRENEQSYVTNEDASYIPDEDLAKAPLVTHEKNQQHSYHYKEYKDYNKENHDNNKEQKAKSKKSLSSIEKDSLKTKPKTTKAKSPKIENQSFIEPEKQITNVNQQTTNQQQRESVPPENSKELELKNNFPNIHKAVKHLYFEVVKPKNTKWKEWVNTALEICKLGFSAELVKTLEMIKVIPEKQKLQYLTGMLINKRNEFAEAQRLAEAQEERQNLEELLAKFNNNREEPLRYVGHDEKHKGKIFNTIWASRQAQRLIIEAHAVDDFQDEGRFDASELEFINAV